MTTKKILIIVFSIIFVLALVVVIVAAGIVGVVFYSINNSDAAKVSKEFLRSNDKLKQEIGEVKDFGTFVTGNINTANGEGAAQLHFKVIGERKEVNATVELIYRTGRPWRVTAASYQNDAGEKVELLDPYEARIVTVKLAA